MLLFPDKAVLITAPNTTPVTLAEAKAQLNFVPDIDDTIFRRLIQTATNEAQKWTGRKFVYQTWDIYAQSWPVDMWKLPFGWLQSVDKIYYTDTDGNTTLLDSSVYDVNTAKMLGRVSLGYNQNWPTVTLAPTNPIRIRFSCGWYYGEEWTSSNTYRAGTYVIPTSEKTNGLVYYTETGGDSNSSEPEWPLTLNDIIVDNTVTWKTIGPVVDSVVRNAILISIASYYEERGDRVITQGGTEIDLDRIKDQLGYLKIHYTGVK